MENGRYQSDARSQPYNKFDNAILSNIHRGDYTMPVNTSTTTVSDLHFIKGFLIQSSWSRSDSLTFNGQATSFRRPDDDGTRITFISHDLSRTPKAVDNFEQFLQGSSHLPKSLFSESAHQQNKAHTELLDALASILGTTNVGDNQLTSAAQLKDSASPSFHVDTARVEQINGKKVLTIDGWFTQIDEQGHQKRDQEGPLKRHYTGIFTTGENGLVNEVYLQADSKMSFTASKAPFRAVVRSIEW